MSWMSNLICDLTPCLLASSRSLTLEGMLKLLIMVRSAWWVPMLRVSAELPALMTVG